MTFHNGKALSGNGYIAVNLRGKTMIGVQGLTPLVVVAPWNCNHENTVCETAECLNSWSLDFQFFLTRTARGRKIIERFHLTDDQIKTLASSDFRSNNPRHDPFDSKYDHSSTRKASR